MDLSDDVSTSSNLVDEDEDNGVATKNEDSGHAAGATAAGNGDFNGKKRRHMSSYPDTSLFKSYNSTSSDGKVSLVILKQPEKQHRARYHTEGSRGAVKDRGQTGFPTVQLRGYHAKKAAVLQVFIGSDTGTPIPHLYYQACKVSGKNSTPCREMKTENTDVILIDMEPDKDRKVVCDCVGILKERHSDIEGKVPPNKRVNWKKKTTKCRIVFRVELEPEPGSEKKEILQAVTDTISCTQLPGTPEILKMNLTTCSIEGGEELWLIGKNFLKDTEVVFKEESSNSHNNRSLWCEKVKPIKEFFSNNHLIVVVPPYKDPNSTELVVINLTVKCGSKTSEPRPLTFKPTQQIVKLNGLLQPTNNGLAVVNLNGNPANLMMVNNMQGTALKADPEPYGMNASSRPCVLEQIEEHVPSKNLGPHVSRVSKKKRERKTPFSRTREMPDIDAEEAIFETLDSSSTSLDRTVANWSALLQRHTRQQSADRIQEQTTKTVIQNPSAYRQQILIPEDTTNNTNLVANDIMEETSNQHTLLSRSGNVNIDGTTVTSPTSCFENLSFSTNGPLSFSGISKTGFKLTTQRSPSGVNQQDQVNTVVTPSVVGASVSSEIAESHFVCTDQGSNIPPVVQQAAQNEINEAQQQTSNPAPPQAVKHENSCSLGFENSGSESATISIKLPPSVLQNQKQLSTIVNTISKALQPSSQEPEPESQDSQQQQQQQQQNVYSPVTDATSVHSPPSVLSVNAAQSWSQSPPDSTGILQDTTTWISEDTSGFEKKRKRVLDSEYGVNSSSEKPQESNQAWTNNGGGQASTVVAPVVSQDTVNNWSTTQSNQVSWVTTTTMSQPSALTRQTSWVSASDQTPGNAGVKAESTNSTVQVTPATTWAFVSSSSTTPCTFATVTPSTTNENSSDSGSCTKWENINAKPLGVWPPPNDPTPPVEQTYTNWTAATDVNMAQTTTWTTGQESKAWPTTNDLVNQIHHQPVATIVPAEMMPVNPKEVSPMDVDDILRCPGAQNATSSSSDILAQQPMASSNNPPQFLSTRTTVVTNVVSKLTPIVVTTIAGPNVVSQLNGTAVDIMNSYRT